MCRNDDNKQINTTENKFLLADSLHKAPRALLVEGLQPQCGKCELELVASSAKH